MYKNGLRMTPTHALEKPSMPRRRHRAARLLLLAALLASGATDAGEPGRLEADADFLLGRWSSDCAAGDVHIFLRDGALRQQGLLRLAPKGGGDPMTPVTLLAATRDGPGLVLEARSDAAGFRASARYTTTVVTDDRLALRAMTLCREQRCRTMALEVPWARCPQ
jgi:hypothetical protein